jgi:eukaryotic-like serine/threonine-protein kinase
MSTPLTATDIAALSRLIDELLALPADDRSAWLTALAPADQHLMPALRGMLAEHEGARAPAVGAELPTLGDTPDTGTPQPGERVGPYQLLRQIGQGGMGSVWLAERADGALARQVALKLPRLAWDAGLAARVARERDIGALLEHPNIARLYDAGVDAQGRPFLALEYIAGQPIDAWCAAQALDVAARLRLFVQVVRAVAYAHGRLVIHRDLKPANVLVSADGQAHLLDFGIARRLHESERGGSEQTPQAQHTQTHELHRALTPRYASPEQISGEALTVQSDVYSLGVLLYELLTGASPIAPKRASPGAVENAILHGHSPAASTRAPDPATARALRGDLDAILAQAMQREPARRYPTADALAQDIECHLAGLPVQAQPDSWGYRLGKLLRRHWLAFGSVTLGLTAVLALAVVAIWQAHRAAGALDEAQQAAQRARVVKDFVIDLFKLDTPGAAGRTEARELPVELLLERGARLIEPRFADQPALQSELLGVVAQIMLDMHASHLAIEYASRHRSAVTSASAPPDERARAALLLARALAAAEIGREARLVLREGLALAPSAELRAQLRLALLDLQLNNPEMSELAVLLAALRADLADTSAPLLNALADQAEARVKAKAGKLDDATALLTRAVATAQAAQGPGSRIAAQLQLRQGELLAEAGRAVQARQVTQQAVAALRGLGGGDDIEAALGEAASVARTGRQAWRYDEAAAVFAHSLAVIDRYGRRLPPQVRANVEDQQACVELEFGQVEKGYALAVRSARTLRGDQPYGHRSSCLGRAAMMAGRHAESETEFQRYLGHLWPSHGCDAGCAAQVYVGTAHNRLMQGRADEARALLDEVPRLDARLSDKAPDGPPLHWVRAARARVELDSGRPAAALSLLQGLTDGRHLMNDSAALRAEAQCRSGPDSVLPALPVLRARVQAAAADEHPDSPWLADLRARLGLCEALAGRHESALAQSRMAHRALAAQPGVSPAYRRVLRELDGRVGVRH